MLESILYERDEKQRRHQCFLCHIEMCCYRSKAAAPQLHQLYIVQHEFHLHVCRDKMFLAVIQRIPQQVAEPCYGILCFLSIHGRKSRDVVKSVEKEMRVKLVFQPCHFSFCIFLSLLPQFHLQCVSSKNPSYSECREYGKYLQCYGHQDECHETRHHIFRYIHVGYFFHPTVCKEDNGNVADVEQQFLTLVIPFRNKEIEIGDIKNEYWNECEI